MSLSYVCACVLFVLTAADSAAAPGRSLSCPVMSRDSPRTALLMEINKLEEMHARRKAENRGHKVATQQLKEEWLTELENFAEDGVVENYNKPSQSELRNSKKAIIDCINKYRAKHRAPALVQSAEINKVAQKWAEKLVKTHQLVHQQGKYGENLWSFNSSPPRPLNPSAACTSWYMEYKLYKYGEDFKETTGHFTQLVWKSSKEIGVGVANAGGSWVVVADFYPRGNVMGSFKENVLPEHKGKK